MVTGRSGHVQQKKSLGPDKRVKRKETRSRETNGLLNNERNKVQMVRIEQIQGSCPSDLAVMFKSMFCKMSCKRRMEALTLIFCDSNSSNDISKKLAELARCWLVVEGEADGVEELDRVEGEERGEVLMRELEELDLAEGDERGEEMLLLLFSRGVDG